MWTSYAQNFEDVILLRAFSHIERGVYVDVGAHDPVFDSVSLAFYERGWRGVNIEPVPEFAERLRLGRPDETVIQAVVRSTPQPMTFYSVAETGLSTGDPEIAAKYVAEGRSVETILVESRPLSSILDEVPGGVVHWLKIDVEGMERAVLESWGDSPVRPWVLVIESTLPNSTEAGYEAWEHIVFGLDYKFVYFDGLNRFYVSPEHPELEAAFRSPPNCFDDFSVTEHSFSARGPAARLMEAEAARRDAQAQAVQLAVERDQLAVQCDALRAERSKLAAQCDYLMIGRDRLAGELEATQQASQTYHDLWQSAERTIIALRASTSWKATAALRKLTAGARFGVKGLTAWLLFKPDSRPYRVVRRILKPLAARQGEAVEAALAATGARYVFVDHTVSCDTNTGIQRVVRGLCKAYLASGAPVRFVKWNETAGACVLIDAEDRAWLGRWNGPPLHPLEAGVYPPRGGPAVVVAHAAEPDGRLIVPEVTHMSGHGASLTSRLIAWARNNGLTANFVFYDAIPLKRPELAVSAPVHAQYMRDLRLADVIWPISRWSADELCSFWGADREANANHLPAVRPIHLPGEFDRPRTVEVRPSEHVILCVGTIEPRKNQVALVRAFQAILAERPGCDWRLILAGNLHPAVADEIGAATAPGSQIEYLGHIDDSRLSDLYGACAFTVFPSVEEGFGLPVLESLWCGKPCLCADFGAMAEVAAAGGVLQVDVRDPAALKAGIEKLIDDADLRRMLAEEAVARPMRTWNDYRADIDLQVGQQGLIYYWVDATVTFPANTGIQRVVRQLARTLIEAGFSLVPVKWGGAEQPFSPVSLQELEYFARWNGPPPDAWMPWVSPAEASGGWFIMAELPLNLSDAEQKLLRGAAERAGLETAAIFYDPIPWKLREIYPAPFANAHRHYMLELENYSVVLPISRYSKDELVSFLSGENRRPRSCLGHIMACPLVGEFPELPDEATAPPADDGLVRILCVGTVEPRKNHERLLDAFELACGRAKSRLHLTIVGGGHSIEPDLAVRIRARVDASPHMEWEEKADDLQIARFYAACDFSVYPSVEEGFGLPILESLHYGKPVVCANFGAMMEVSEGGGCLTVNVFDTEALAQAIVDLADSPDTRRRLAEEAQSRPVRTWRDYARDVADKLGLWVRPDAETVARHRREMGLDSSPPRFVGIARDADAPRSGLAWQMDGAVLREELVQEGNDRTIPRRSERIETLGAPSDCFIYYWIDSTITTPVNTGIQRVVRQLARALLDAGFPLIPVKWGGVGRPLHPVSQKELQHFALWNGPEPHRWSAWRNPGSGWFLTAELPLQHSDAEQKMFRAAAEAANLKTAAVVHDTIPWKLRDIYPATLANAHKLYLSELYRYDRVLANSRYTQHEMIKVLREDLHVRGPFGHILANPLPAEFPERSEEPQAGPPAEVARRTVEILCVGTVEPRKNHLRMLEAFERAARRSKAPLRLVMVGGRHHIWPDLAVRVRARVDRNPSMTWEEKADDAHIRALYRRCDFTIYPSMEEGFGMPILESLWYGKPVICADFGSMSEVAEGGGCVTIDVRDTDALASAIVELASDPDCLGRLAEEARRRTFRTWADYASDVAEALGLRACPEQDVERQPQAVGLGNPPRLSV